MFSWNISVFKIQCTLVAYQLFLCETFVTIALCLRFFDLVAFVCWWCWATTLGRRFFVYRLRFCLVTLVAFISLRFFDSIAFICWWRLCHLTTLAFWFFRLAAFTLYRYFAQKVCCVLFAQTAFFWRLWFFIGRGARGFFFLTGFLSIVAAAAAEWR